VSNDSDLISIILPVYNGERFLAQSIESCLSQTHKNLELIIINDYSTDASLSIAKHYEDLDSRVKVYSNTVNLRLPKSLNKGHEMASGAYITWTSDDNRFRESALENLLNHLKRHKADLVYAHCDVINNTGKITGFLNAKAADHLLFENVVGACFLYTKEIYAAVGYYNAQMVLIEDYDFWLRVAKQGIIKASDEILYEYRQHEDSLTSQIKNNQKINKAFKVSKRTMYQALLGLEELIAPTELLRFLENSTFDIIGAQKIFSSPVFFKDFYTFSNSFKGINAQHVVQMLIHRLVEFVLCNPELQQRSTLTYLYKSSPRSMLAIPLNRQLALVKKCI